MVVRNSGLTAAVVFCIFILAKTSNAQVGAECWGLGMCGSWLLDCIKYVCTCREGYIASIDNSDCVIGINEKCRAYSDKCYDINASCEIPGSTRIDSCTCKENFSQDQESQLCYHDLGTECETDGTPCIDGNCIDGTCQCEAGLIENELKNNCGIAVGGSCSSASTCADGNADCNIANICECKEDYQRTVNADGLTVCRKRLGVLCSSNNECAPTNSSCETMLNGKKICTCNLGYIPSGERTSCLKVTNHWQGACEENTQCIAGFGRHSVCQSNTCTCANGYTYSSEDFGCVI